MVKFQSPVNELCWDSSEPFVLSEEFTEQWRSGKFRSLEEDGEIS